MDLSKARWRKASFSGDNGGNCVEVAEVTDHARLIAVRDSKDPDGPKLFFTPAEWDAFIAGVKAAEFDIG
ncbi:DUF397 domain-containing protein [Microtetraspora sp. NBRC 16547]|uniref:DUF397 domain-containing protein n=1 Tax=Microtetraspora sp. NBRC 16547 TaxID=3030993 RepID=UPI0024A25B90|nr:DUF397 domain-containing protein [Microtetraspora sp. NBRC 16547]GLX02404.1 hypothetical protein Misp02_64900 [Microtetraspora sp. NBRC 16547]